jgi:hypothetical protein
MDSSSIKTAILLRRRGQSISLRWPEKKFYVDRGRANIDKVITLNCTEKERPPIACRGRAGDFTISFGLLLVRHRCYFKYYNVVIYGHSKWVCGGRGSPPGFEDICTLPLDFGGPLPLKFVPYIHVCTSSSKPLNTS